MANGRPMPIMVRAKPVMKTMTAVDMETMMRDLQSIGQNQPSSAHLGQVEEDMRGLLIQMNWRPSLLPVSSFLTVTGNPSRYVGCSGFQSRTFFALALLTRQFMVAV